MSSPEPIVTDVRGLSARRVWAFVAVAAILSGLVVGLAGEKYYHHVPAIKSTVQMPLGPVQAVTDASQAVADTKNGVILFGSLGATLGLALGLAGGLARRSMRTTISAGLIGLTLGAVAGLGGGRGLLAIYFREQAKLDDTFSADLAFPMLIRSGIFGLIGAVGGLALAIGAGTRADRVASATFGGFIGGAIGAVVYELVAAFFFPDAHTNHPIAQAWPPRVIAMASACLFSAAGAAFALLAERRSAPVTPPPTTD